MPSRPVRFARRPPALWLLGGLLALLASGWQLVDLQEPVGGGVALGPAADEPAAAASGWSVELARERLAREVTKPGRSLAIHVTVAANSNRDAKRFGGLDFELGVAHGELGWRMPPLEDLLVLARGTSDAAGESEVRLEVPAEWMDETDSVLLFGRVVAPGFQEQLSKVALPERDVEILQFRLQAKRGATVRGLVVGPDGEPQTATISVVTGDDGSTTNYDSTRTTNDGRFELGFDEDTPCRLLAVQYGVGTAISERLPNVLASAPQELRLELSGSGVLAGVLLDPDGEPMPRFELWAGLVPSRESQVGSLSSNEKRRLESEGRGIASTHFLTDDAGRFRLTGLRPGSWAVYARSARSGYGFDRRLTPAPVASGSEDLRLVLERTVLVVRVEDARGEPVRVGVEFSTRSPRTETALFCRESDELGRILKPLAYGRIYRHFGDGDEVVFDVEPGRHYVFGVVSPDAPVVEGVLFIPHDHWSTTYTLVLPDASAKSSLRIQLEEPDGTAFKGTNHIVVETPESGLILFESEKNGTQTEYELQLAAGTYRVSADDWPSFGPHGGRYGKDRFARAETLVTLEPGGQTDLPIRLEEAGTVEITVAASAETPSSNRRFRDLVLHPIDGGPSVRLLFEASLPGFLGTHNESAVDSSKAKEAISPVRAGKYTLRALLNGNVPVEVPVTIPAGRTTRVEL